MQPECLKYMFYRFAGDGGDVIFDSLWVSHRLTKKVSFMLQDMHTHQRYCNILRTRVTKENSFKSRKNEDDLG
ncbi:hypothetical protein HanXRQr2_Chr11g0472071 [Helianthus annuus]|uniref:Uncharacterized protein n=1 Tax=Helianthus annuus TaxID=4232 RepID=A0A9K3MYG1_HELAN|nr:hypothetical protein HanXRQr2_Chr11g0472071 [Helianthus annuus]KAJ0873687.1 hypothetical protein HanPSC8_Chr11g0455341 [Helianthus annuus]